MATTTPTFKGPVRGREYGGKIARRVTWTFDSGQTDPSNPDETRGVLLTVEHSGKQYRITLQEVGLHPVGFVVKFGLGGGGDKRRTIYSESAPRFSEKRFQQVIDSMTNAEAACREFHEAVSA